MNTKETTREQISAFADGALADSQLDATFMALRNEDAKADWELYHRIGDALRSDDIANVRLNTDFAASLMIKLEAEPTIIGPLSNVNADSSLPSTARRCWLIPGFAAALGMAGVTFFATPHLMVASVAHKATASNVAALSTTRAPAAMLASSNGKQLIQNGVVAASASEGVVMRDARMDDYLLAHQRFSSPLYSTARYARSATLAAEAGK